MLALPEARLAVGVKVAVRVRPLPLIAPSVPPLTATSPVLPFQANVAPGSSLKVKVTVAVSPVFTAPTLLVIARVGAVVSMTIALLAPSEFAAPGEASVNVAARPLLVALMVPLLSANAVVPV